MIEMRVELYLFFVFIVLLLLILFFIDQFASSYLNADFNVNVVQCGERDDVWLSLIGARKSESIREEKTSYTV